MGEVPHAGGLDSESTTYEITKATAIETLRRSLATFDGGWISAVEECRVSMVDGVETCSLTVLTSGCIRPEAEILLFRRDGEIEFPFSKVEVEMILYSEARSFIFTIDKNGKFKQIR